MHLEKKPFGNFKTEPIDQYIIENDHGLTVKVINYGATITSISIPEGQEKLDLVCGFDTLEGYLSSDYLSNAPYFGCTVGRYASRIKDGKFSIDGQEYQLAVNDGTNHLHGGLKGFDKQIWSVESVEENGAPEISMTLESPHLNEGYPGNIRVKVDFLINNDNELIIDYTAHTDRRSPLSLTNHTYFNLSAFKQSIENHRAIILANAYLEPDPTNVPLGGITKVEGTPADLRSGKLLKDAFDVLKTGFEHYYIFDNNAMLLKKVAEFTDSESGRKLEVSTTEPGMLFYTGYYTSDQLHRENGDQFGRFRGFCCETHRYPNGPNIENSPASITDAGETFKSQTIFKFHW